MNGPHRERFTRSAGTALGAAIAKRSAPSAWPTYVARQPVYDRDRNVVAYELLFRDGADATTASVVDAQAATGEAALTAMADGRVSDGEAALLRRAGAQVGYAEADIQQLLKKAQGELYARARAARGNGPR